MEVLVTKKAFSFFLLENLGQIKKLRLLIIRNKQKERIIEATTIKSTARRTRAQIRVRFYCHTSQLAHIVKVAAKVIASMSLC